MAYAELYERLPNGTKATREEVRQTLESMTRTWATLDRAWRTFRTLTEAADLVPEGGWREPPNPAWAGLQAPHLQQAQEPQIVISVPALGSAEAYEALFRAAKRVFYDD